MNPPKECQLYFKNISNVNLINPFEINNSQITQIIGTINWTLTGSESGRYDV